MRQKLIPISWVPKLTISATQIPSVNEKLVGLR